MYKYKFEFKYERVIPHYFGVKPGKKREVRRTTLIITKRDDLLTRVTVTQNAGDLDLKSKARVAAMLKAMESFGSRLYRKEIWKDFHAQVSINGLRIKNGEKEA